MGGVHLVRFRVLTVDELEKSDDWVDSFSLDGVDDIIVNATLNIY